MRDFWSNVVGTSDSGADSADVTAPSVQDTSGQDDADQPSIQTIRDDGASTDPVPAGKKIMYVSLCVTENKKWLSDCLEHYADAVKICDAHYKATKHDVAVLITNVECPRPPDPAPDPPLVPATADPAPTAQDPSGQDTSDTSGQDGG
jgi:hypothetical protein